MHDVIIKNPQLILLDEAGNDTTSALEWTHTAAEKEIQDG
jgi:hypothetical protein